MAMRPALALLPLLCAARLAAGGDGGPLAGTAAADGGSSASGSPALGSKSGAPDNHSAPDAAGAPLRELEEGTGGDASLGSCAYYGCSKTFRPLYACQCTPGCERQQNCCHDHESMCRAPARVLIDDSSAAMALRADSNAPWKQDGAPGADAGAGAAPDAGKAEAFQEEESNAADLAISQPAEIRQTQLPQEPQQPVDDGTIRPHGGAQQEHKKPTPWVLPVAGVFAALGTVLLVIAGAQKICRRGAAARRGPPNAVVPLRGRDSDNTRPNMPLMDPLDQQDANVEDDIVSIFEGQVKEARQRAKSLTRKARPAPIDVAKPPARPLPAN